MPTTADHPSRAHIVAALLRDGDRVLLCLRSQQKLHHPGVWDAAGGHVEPGELPAAALVREFQEELAIDIAPPSAPPDLEIHGDTFHMQIWLIEQWTGTPVNAEPTEHEAIAWYTRAELAALPLAHGDVLATFIQGVLGRHR